LSIETQTSGCCLSQAYIEAVPHRGAPTMKKFGLRIL
jgi:hypothetical protein